MMKLVKFVSVKQPEKRKSFFGEGINVVVRFLSAEPCVFPCLNGGQCIQSESCDCSLYQATGHRCQTGKLHT